jgi:hypothetical protein
MIDMKLSATQTKALKTIAENPGKVANNWNLTTDDLLYIRSTTGQSLAKAGLVTGEQTDMVKTYTYPGGHTIRVEIVTWELTGKGREYLSK